MAGGEEEFRGWRGYMEPPPPAAGRSGSATARRLLPSTAPPVAGGGGATAPLRRKRQRRAAARASCWSREWEGEAEAADAAQGGSAARNCAPRRDFFVLEPVVPQWRRTALEAAGQAKRVRIQLLPAGASAGGGSESQQ
ncbi:hypothetical protein JKP88DRAFT_291111 [Tribonema minus]|uniref:Uncharacterized protein n=1 Tax=Tribonema minus TaxID=303371 RepID=A0A836CBM7_9STRA|nr:hypothetical protein JKP88DRAFT_291111 [Tribonema minus]